MNANVKVARGIDVGKRAWDSISTAFALVSLEGVA